MYLTSCGMVTAVGLSFPAATAALRAGIAGFAETPFCDQEGKPIIGAAVPLSPEGQWESERLLPMLVPAVRECLGDMLQDSADIPLILCLSEPGFPGRRPMLDAWLIGALQAEMQIQFHPDSSVIAEGRAGAAAALERARSLLQRSNVKACLIAGADSFLNYETLAAYEEMGRLRRESNPDGIIPGEAAAAVLVAISPSPQSGWPAVQIAGIGGSKEAALITSDAPNVGEGLAQAIKAALVAAQLEMIDIDWRISDLTGERYGFRETNYALAKLLRGRKEFLHLWHCMDSLGDTGATAGICMLVRAMAAFLKHYDFGPNVLCQSSAESGQRAAVVLKNLTATGH
jgi:3-oxoacyl-[acyl-carrier-protein] synthase I